MTESALAAYPVRIRLPVQWGEMDSYGHLNNAVYFRYFESARIEYLQRCGFLEAHRSTGIGAILHSVRCRFRRPLHHPDWVHVGARVSAIGEDRFTQEYLIVSENSGEVAAQGEGVIVSYDYGEGARAPLPATVRAGIAGLEGGLEGGPEGGRERDE